MDTYQLGDKERQFADIVWEKVPTASKDLVQAAKESLGWAKSTTYTMLKRLIDRGLFENHDGIVRARMTPEEFATGQSHQFVEEHFGGSLPGFLTAFSDGKKLSDAEIRALEKLIEENRRS